MSGGHTPGPWVANRERFIKAENGWTIAQVRGPSGRGKEFVEGLPFCDANARLISAAPDLLEALESIRLYANDTLSGRADGPDDRKWQRDAVVEIRNRARAAIAKATGAA